MRAFSIALAACLVAALPAPAAARPWQGITPGVTTAQEVQQKFGEPTNRTKRTNRTVLAYFGEQALPGTRQAQFHVDPAGVVVEITIFLTAELDAASVEGTYGKPPQKTFVEDTFQKVWLYPQSGVTVYFNKEGNVEALTFSPAKPKGTAPEPPKPTGQPAAGEGAGK